MYPQQAIFRSKPFSRKTTPPSRVDIRLLVIFTEEARVETGGNPLDTSDSANLKSLIVNTIDIGNLALRKSGINVNIELGGILLDEDFVVTGNADTDLTNLQSDAGLDAARDKFWGDFFSAVFGSSSDPFFCGAARVQRPGCGDFMPITGCDVGEAFSEFAYHWTNVNCLILKPDILTHEIGHNLGAEHNIEAAVPVANASFPFSFGHWIDDGAASFQTIMSVRGFDRILRFSNPRKSYDGAPMGVSDSADNARTIEALAASVAAFRSPRPDFIFGESFEFGDLVTWPEIVTGAP